MTRFLLVAACIAALSLPAQADDVTDTMDAARAAYDAGDIQEAIEELTFAMQLLRDMKTDSLSGFLPEAPSGWTREITTDMAQGLAVLGGGVGAEATYAGGGKRFTVTVMADNPMVASVGGMLSNAALFGMKRVRAGGEKFFVQAGQLMALIGNRVLIQAEGADVDTMVALLSEMDFAGIEAFGG